MSRLSRRTVLAGAAGIALAPLLAARKARATTPLPPALFVAAHPDDETLAMGVPLVEHIAAGQQVHMLWLSSGEASAVRGKLNGQGTAPWWGVVHDPGAEGYEPLTTETFAAARLAEGQTAVGCMATGLAGTVTFHTAGLPDGALTEAAARQAILDVADLIAPAGPVRLKTHTHLVDNHPDHLAAGHAARALVAEVPARFSDLRHYVLSDYWTDSRLAQVAEAWDLPTDGTVTSRVRNALRAYGAWAPPRAFAIGWQSVPQMFSKIEAAPKAMFHP